MPKGRCLVPKEGGERTVVCQRRVGVPWKASYHAIPPSYAHEARFCWARHLRMQRLLMHACTMDWGPFNAMSCAVASTNGSNPNANSAMVLTLGRLTD